MKLASERHVKAVILTFMMIAISCVSTSAPPPCGVPADDRAWIDRSLAAWRLATLEIAGITSFPANQAPSSSARIAS